MTETFEEIALELNELPTLPMVVSKVLKLLGDPGSSVVDIEKIVSNDQAVAGKILKVANSAYYGFRSKVVTIRHATVLLGFGMVRTLCLGIGVFHVFDNRELSKILNVERFWEHCIAVATASRMVWEDGGNKEDESVFLAGLLHDVGKTTLISVKPAEYVKVLRKARKDKKPLIEVEREFFGGDHAKLGGMLCRQWNFASELTVPISRHHRPMAADEQFRNRAATVHLADYICRRADIGWSGDPSEPVCDKGALDLLKLDGSKLSELIKRLEGLKSEIASFTQAVI